MNKSVPGFFGGGEVDDFWGVAGCVVDFLGEDAFFPVAPVAIDVGGLVPHGVHFAPFTSNHGVEAVLVVEADELAVVFDVFDGAPGEVGRSPFGQVQEKDAGIKVFLGGIESEGLVIKETVFGGDGFDTHVLDGEEVVVLNFLIP